MRVTILQPTYLPWLGYFEMIARSELFVLFDHVQFAKKSWQQRNRIKGPNGEVMLSVPVLSDGKQDVPICEKRVDYQQTWFEKHAKSVDVAYRKAPHFARYFEPLKALLAVQYASVGAMNEALIRWMMGELGLGHRRVVRSSTLGLPDETNLDKSQRVLNVCKAVNTTVLYDGAAAAEFLGVELLASAGVEVVFQNYAHPTYPQLHGPFLPYMSALDLMMNCGPESREIILSAGDTTASVP